MGAPKAAVRDASNEVMETLRAYPFFRNFGDELLTHLASALAFLAVRKGNQLLEQGQVNGNLYILVNGRLGVTVDGGRVATLDRPGDLIGEMSVVSHQPCSATITAETDCELYRLKADELKSAAGPNEDRIQHLLYRIYSQAMADKLKLTNQKAKKFEEANLRLQEAQEKLRLINVELENKVEERTLDLKTANLKLESRNAEVTASHRRLEELYANRSATFSHLQKLYRDHLVPLRLTLDSLPHLGDAATRNTIADVRSEVLQAIQLLEPITTLYSTELAMRSKRVLLAEPNKKQQIVAKMALGGTGVQLEIAEDTAKAKEALAQSACDILFVDSSMLELANEAVARNPSVKTVLMTSDNIPNYLPHLKKLSFMPNIVSRSDEDRTFTIKNIGTTVTKLASHDIFGLEKYLAWGVEVKEHAVMRSSMRADLIQSMDTHFESLGVRRTSRERCAVVVEELLMNAIYDAPVGEGRRPLYNHLPRTVEVELEPEQYGKFRYATDGVLLAVSVEDPFGSLSGTTILNYLQSCYGGSAGQLNAEQGKGGAGRGLHQIVENSDLVVFNLQPGTRTEVIAIFNVDVKSATVQYPTFHLFMV